MANLNPTVRRWNNGGLLKIGTDVILNVESGTLKFQAMPRARIEYSDRGIQQQPLEGDDQNMDIEFTVNSGVYSGATSLYAALVAAGSSGLVATLSSFTIDIPDYRGAATGTRFVWTTATVYYVWVAELPSFQAGSSPDGLDKLSCKLRANHAPTISTY